MRWQTASLAAVAALLACAGGSGPAPPAPADAAVADEVAEFAAHALEADGERVTADSLYRQDAEIIADGRRRTTVPRYAGVGERGRVVVGSTRVDLAGEFAWAVVAYRWLSADENLIREGQASLLLVRETSGGRWQIVHAHSSLAH